MNDHWDCPTCGRPTPTEIDVECHCGMMSSHHVSVWTMCHRLREVQQRESALIVENKRLKEQIQTLQNRRPAVSDTPETDAMCICTHHKSFAATGGVVNPDFARRLENERDEARGANGSPSPANEKP